jgi:hypothetical protein
MELKSPKEKAKELVDKYYTLHWGSEIGKSMYYPIKSALIAVDEMIKIGWNLPHYGNLIGEVYWQQVKQEIENL